MNKIVLSILLIVGGATVFVFGAPWYDVFPTNGSRVYYLVLTLFWLIVSLVLKRMCRPERYWQAAYALFCASAPLLCTSTGILNLHREGMDPVRFLALDKLSQFLYVVPLVIVLALLAGRDLGSLYIAAGRLRQGLTFGLISFVGFAAAAIFLNLRAPALATLRAGIPWVLLFVFANAIMEELWFRALFLKPYEALVGRTAAIAVTALLFGASHVSATYAFPGGPIVYGLVVVGLGVVGAYAMTKDKGLIGPVLFHAGYDLMIMVPILNSL
ncbi:MAG: CPBP family intramembrane metalloprotease [Anaerolineae bacterium]|nr:CPBP family intramembrane metalloprotease [Anaerolineae bacterium]